VAPGEETRAPVELAPPAEADTVRRQAQRPRMPAQPQPYVRTAKKGNLNVLEGKVVSMETGQPEEGVRVTLSNRLGIFADRPALTDAYGRFAVKLPDGDWTVKVTTPRGRIYAVSQLTVSNGQITDDQGRDIPSLTITR
jgi:hypothetical protein